MKNYKIHSIICLLSLAAVVSCKKSTAPYATLTDSKANTLIYIAKAAGTTQTLAIFPFADTARTINFAASFGGVGLPKNPIPVQFAVDSKAFDSLNVSRANAGLQPYLLFPSNAYTLSASSATIPAGGVTSNLVTVSYFSKMFDATKDYLLPISITGANGYKIGANKSIFLVAPKLQETKAVTTGWLATANSEQPAGENTGKASALIDGDLNTIWHAEYSPVPSTGYPYIIQFDMLNPIYVTHIEIAPRQNNGTGPTLFRVEGSLDGSNYTTILDNQSFNPNKRDGTYQKYPFPAPTNIRYLKVTLLQGMQSLSFLSEIAVYRY